MDDPDSNHEAFISLLLRHEPMLRASIRTVVQRPDDVDEIMQSVSLVAWRKFDLLTDREGFGRWAFVIAKYEVLKFQRARARDRFVLDESLVERILDEGVDECEGRAKRLSLLEHCLEKLPETRREMLLQAYLPGHTMRALAERLGMQEDALYQALRRLRLELRACVERYLAREGGAA
jgi:RNA polymerase sigma-70 factor (ECF subfamily)